MRRPVKKRNKPAPDVRHNSEDISKFINYVMHDGKRSVAERIVYEAFDIIEKESKLDPLQTFNTALDKIGPDVEVRSRRVGGANYQVPHEVRPERRKALAMRWILESARSKKGSPMNKILAEELVLASKGEGEAVKKRENTHRMAEANKAFAHFAWQ